MQTPTEIMSQADLAPLVIYDNACHLCALFAQGVNFFARGKIRLVGHYTELGQRLRNELLYPQATEMFWFIDGKTAYGGRAALLPLISCIIQNKGVALEQPENLETCDASCHAPKAVFVRSASLLTSHRKIPLKKQNSE